ncbi:hypothetical protein CEXT_465521, partial [Caerostris extrusa]
PLKRVHPVKQMVFVRQTTFCKLFGFNFGSQYGMACR